MGTRGLMGFSYGEEVKAMYNHWDSYPSGLGQNVADWIVGLTDEMLPEAIEKFNRLEAIDEDVPPTEDQKLALMRYANLNVSEQTYDDWYALLRETQGNPEETLKAIFYVEGASFADDSLFCEWAYIIDLENRVLEIYKGLQTVPHTSGRFADLKSTGGYAPVKLVHTVSFEDLRNGLFSMEDYEEKYYEAEDGE